MKSLSDYIKESITDTELDPELVSYYMDIWFRNNPEGMKNITDFAKEWNINGRPKDKDALMNLYNTPGMVDFTKFCIGDMSKNNDNDYSSAFINIIEQIK